MKTVVSCAGDGWLGGDKVFDDGGHPPSVVNNRMLLEGIDGMALSLAVQSSNAAEPHTDSELRALRAAETLSLSQRALTSMDGLGILIGLRALDLSFNALVALDASALAGMSLLEELDISFNKIDGKALAALAGCRRLRTLSLFHNIITSLEALPLLPALQLLSLGNNRLVNIAELAHLRRATPVLEALSFDGNPARVAAGGYVQARAVCLSLLPHLKYLDHALVLDSWRSADSVGGISSEYAELLRRLTADGGTPAAPHAVVASVTVASREQTSARGAPAVSADAASAARAEEQRAALASRTALEPSC